MQQPLTLNAGDVVAAKGDATISLVIPAKNEEETIGGIVAQLKDAWMDDVPLIDELVVMDSDSTDSTARIASLAGARVHSVRDTQIGGVVDLRPGKGEALWKSLGVTRGSILVFLDGDLIEWHSDYVPRLASPLLVDPSLQLIKAVYDRPMIGDDEQPEESGGRVTELVARPLIARFMPELSHIVQPLAGEWSIRREALESFHVPSGYGVEIAAVIDTARAFGLGSVGQVELSRRSHRHHRHEALGIMSLQVMNAFFRRVEGTVDEPSAIRMPQYAWNLGTLGASETLVDVSERPPMIMLRDAINLERERF